MKQAFTRWTLIGVATLAVGPALAALTASVGDGRGGHATTLLVSASPVASLVVGALAIMVAAGYGVLAGRLSTPRLGLFCAGAAIAWPAFTGATAESLIREAQSTGPLWRMSIEMLLVAALGLAATRVIAARRDFADISGDGDPEETFGRQGALGAGVSFAAAVFAGWVIAREGTPGQNLAAAWIASIAAVAAGRSVAPRASLVACVAGVFLVGVLGPIAGALAQGSEIVPVAYTNTLLPLARITPLNWLAGAWLGAPMGAAWAATTIEQQSESPGAPARA